MTQGGEVPTAAQGEGKVRAGGSVCHTRGFPPRTPSPSWGLPPQVPPTDPDTPPPTRQGGVLKPSDASSELRGQVRLQSWSPTPSPPCPRWEGRGVRAAGSQAGCHAHVCGRARRRTLRGFLAGRRLGSLLSRDGPGRPASPRIPAELPRPAFPHGQQEPAGRHHLSAPGCRR